MFCSEFILEFLLGSFSSVLTRIFAGAIAAISHRVLPAFLLQRFLHAFTRSCLPDFLQWSAWDFFYRIPRDYSESASRHPYQLLPTFLQVFTMSFCRNISWDNLRTSLSEIAGKISEGKQVKFSDKLYKVLFDKSHEELRKKSWETETSSMKIVMLQGNV